MLGIPAFRRRGYDYGPKSTQKVKGIKRGQKGGGKFFVPMVVKEEKLWYNTTNWNLSGNQFPPTASFWAGCENGEHSDL